MSAKDVHFFFNMRNQIKLYHWQTMVYARHKATDEVIEKLDKLIDRYVEVYIGKYGRPRLATGTNTIKLVNMSESTAVRYVETCIKYLIEDLVVDSAKRPADSDLLTIRDEMLADLNQLLYLFTLH
jgi:DNA-binding ferritin-like protein